MKAIKELFYVIGFFVFLFVTDCFLFAFATSVARYARKVTEIGYLTFVVYFLFTLMAILIVSFIYGYIRRCNPKIVAFMAGGYVLFSWLRFSLSFRRHPAFSSITHFVRTVEYLFLLLLGIILGMVFCKLGPSLRAKYMVK